MSESIPEYYYTFDSFTNIFILLPSRPVTQKTVLNFAKSEIAKF